MNWLLLQVVADIIELCHCKPGLRYVNPPDREAKTMIVYIGHADDICDKEFNA